MILKHTKDLCEKLELIHQILKKEISDYQNFTTGSCK
jgi:hypothetical protein